MIIKILGAIVGIVGLTISVYFYGFSVAQTEGELALESLKREQAEAFVTMQQEASREYEQKIENLAVELERVRTDHDSRMRQLEKFRAAGRDLETCNEQRNRLAEIAVGLEEIAD